MKHTKGPWEVGCLVENNCEPRHVGIISGAKMIAKSFYGKTDEECATNAHLIAAAPELLEACKAALACINKNNICEQINDEDATLLSVVTADIYKSITKAEGR